MKDILTAPFISDTVRICTEMYNKGWCERNAGNISMLLDEAELKGYLPKPTASGFNVLRTIPTGVDAPQLNGACFLVSGTGEYLRNVCSNPERSLGIIRLTDGGRAAELLWGFSDGGSFTSELAAHIMTCEARLTVDPSHRVVLHAHPANIVAMSFVHSLDERDFTRTLWRQITECVFVFPDGVGVLPWMLCGTPEIGLATAEKMISSRLVVWAHHGIYGVGTGPEEAFGLVETAEKAAEIYMKTAHLPILQTITDEQLKKTASYFGVEVRPGYLD